MQQSGVWKRCREERSAGADPRVKAWAGPRFSRIVGLVPWFKSLYYHRSYKKSSIFPSPVRVRRVAQPWILFLPLTFGCRILAVSEGAGFRSCFVVLSVALEGTLKDGESKPGKTNTQRQRQPPHPSPTPRRVGTLQAEPKSNPGHINYTMSFPNGNAVLRNCPERSRRVCSGSDAINVDG